MTSQLFENHVFAFSGALTDTMKNIDNLVKSHGAKTTSTVTKATTHLISTPEDFKIQSSKVKGAKKNAIPILLETYIRDSISKNKLEDLQGHLVENVLSTSTSSSTTKTSSVSAASSTVGNGSSLISTNVTTLTSSNNTDNTDKGTTVTKNNKRSRGKSEPSSSSTDTGATTAADALVASVEERNLKKVKVKGKAPVDEYSRLSDIGKVYEDDTGVYSCTLNQTDVSYGVQGHNKFYVIQIIETPGKFIVFNRWGRVGSSGSNSSKEYTDISRAKADFTSKFSEKTRNSWDNRACFHPVNGKYTLIEMDYSNDAEVVDKKKESVDNKATLKTDLVTFEEPPNLESRLPRAVHDLITMIGNVKTMQETLIEFEIDVNKMPLGKLSKAQIQKGYGILQRIQNSLMKTSSEDLSQLSSEFYTLIPHDFGRRRPPLIDSVAALKRKMDMLENLAELEIATKMLSDVSASDAKKIHPVDALYHSLKVNLQPLEKEGDIFKLIDKVVRNTHAPTHDAYSLKLVEAFEVDREGEPENYKAFEGLHNKKLLFHGSRTTNFVGILRQGLRIAPPEAPSTGYMFGKGVYFADAISKSANYCFPRKPYSNDSSPVYGCLLLCEVALGDMLELQYSKYIEPNKDLNGKHSTFGQGKSQPDPTDVVQLPPNNVEVRCGKLVRQPNIPDSGALLYNEFIVYNTNQIRIKYLLKVEFVYGK